MKIIKLAIISAVILFALITALSLLLPSHVRISRAINVNGNKNVLQYIADFNQWKRWNRFIQQADSMGTFEKISDSIIKAGGIEIKLISHDGNSVKTLWKQGNGKISSGDFVVLPGDNYNVVQWYFDFNLNWYPWQKFQSIIYDKQLGPYMEASLQQLKEIIETEQ